MERKEIWKEIEGHPAYFISSYGRVKTRKHEEAKILRQHSYNGSWAVRLCEDGIYEKHQIARLVAEAFLDPPKDRKWRVYHLDGNPDNNTPENLTFKMPSYLKKHIH